MPRFFFISALAFFLRKLCRILNLVRLLPRYWPHKCDVAFDSGLLTLALFWLCVTSFVKQTTGRDTEPTLGTNHSITAVQSNPELQLHPWPVPNLEVSHQTQNVKRHVCNLSRMAVTIPDWQAWHHQQTITDCFYLRRRVNKNSFSPFWELKKCSTLPTWFSNVLLSRHLRTTCKATSIFFYFQKEKNKPLT